ncbi:hypothetical protein VIBHAR_06003 [Vibrio campbellii ATCC BAA-1116]|uniref:Uncharacterized protein n=1 Tax=Vibrio campbellii (strain ATCC BAA-1116) TaxID=2902295 RepID=A7N598_VIBC1|nr:hypothetical protein VIBHAR_06003 [Vibrio campbellii ATCC BAA-1116]
MGLPCLLVELSNKAPINQSINRNTSDFTQSVIAIKNFNLPFDYSLF